MTSHVSEYEVPASLDPSPGTILTSGTSRTKI